MPYSDEDIEAIVDAILEAAGIDSGDYKESDYDYICCVARDVILKEIPEERESRPPDPRRNK